MSAWIHGDDHHSGPPVGLLAVTDASGGTWRRHRAGPTDQWHLTDSDNDVQALNWSELLQRRGPLQTAGERAGLRATYDRHGQIRIAVWSGPNQDPITAVTLSPRTARNALSSLHTALQHAQFHAWTLDRTAPGDEPSGAVVTSVPMTPAA